MKTLIRLVPMFLLIAGVALAQAAQTSGKRGRGKCGDGRCDRRETAQNCSQDCSGEQQPKSRPSGNGKCGDGTCDGPETSTNCPQDCSESGQQGRTGKGKCGDGQCKEPENAQRCPQDCGSTGKSPSGNKSDDVYLQVDQSRFYKGTADECWYNSGKSTLTDDSGFKVSPSSRDGSADAPLLISLVIHIEPDNAYRRDQDTYELHRDGLTRLGELVASHGGKLTIQTQQPFVETSTKLNDGTHRAWQKDGHEIAIHMHENMYISGARGEFGTDVPVEEWTTALTSLREQIDVLVDGSLTNWSGGNLYDRLWDVATAADLWVNSNYKDPSNQNTDAIFRTVSPWRPQSSGSAEVMGVHDPDGPIVYIPSGVYPAHCEKASGMPRPYTTSAFDYLTTQLINSLQVARAGSVNTFYVTLHPGDFADVRDDDHEFDRWDEWLTSVVDPLVADGRLQWSTITEMAEAFLGQEGGEVKKDNGGRQTKGGGSSSVTEVLYRQADTCDLYGDIYEPDGKGPFPAVVLVHGGAFVTGDRADRTYDTWGNLLQQNDFLAFSVDYRLASTSGDGSSRNACKLPAGDATFPRAVQDVKCAVKWLRANADDLNVDADKIFVLGGSAGGYFASMIGTSGDEKSLEDSCGSQRGQEIDGQSSAVQGAVSFFGPWDWVSINQQRERMEPEEAFLGANCQEPASAGGLCEMASASTYADANDPPFFAAHSDDDPAIPVSQSRELRSDLKRLGVDVTYAEISGKGHGWHGSCDHDDEVGAVCAQVVDWLKALSGE